LNFPIGLCVGWEGKKLSSLKSWIRRKYFDSTAHIIFSLICGLICLSLNACLTADAEEIELVDRIVAVVNDEIISLFELEQLFKPYAESIRMRGLPSEQEEAAIFKIREQILNRLIEQKLTDQEVRRLGISVSEKEVYNAIERFKEANFYTDEDMRQALAGEGMNMEDFRERIENQILRAKVVNLEVKSKIVITKEDVKAYYDESGDDYRDEKQYHLRNILLKVSNLADGEDGLKIRKKLEDIRAKVIKGESFEKMAKKYSQAPSAEDGGNLGTLGISTFSPQLGEAVKDMKPGEITPVMNTDWGYQIFLVENVTDSGGKTVEDASPEIEEKLYNEIVEEKFRSWFEALRKRSHIRIVK